jgi:D-alanyl-D-alanine carboxypeptidase (penicillin-binding protein 5/6)
VCLEARQLDLDVSAEAAVLMNADTGALLYEKSSQERLYPASTTKLATALYVVALNEEFLGEETAAVWDDVASISTRAKVESNYSHPSHWLETNSSHMGLKVGEVFTIRELLEGHLLVSANDASNVLAHYLGGSIPNFVDELNSYLKSIGCTATEFRNPSGTHDPKHMTTALDLARIASAAFQYPLIREITSSPRFYRKKTKLQDEAYLASTNQLVRRGKYFYPYCIGAKTGWTSHAKSCIVAAASFQGRTLVAVLLKSESRDSMFRDVARLFEAAFAEEGETHEAIPKGLQAYALHLKHAARPIQADVRSPIHVHYYPSEAPRLRAHVDWQGDLTLPIKEGALIGHVAVCDESGHEYGRQSLYAHRTVKMAWLPWVGQGLWGQWTQHRNLYLLLCLGACLLGLYAGLRLRI